MLYAQVFRLDKTLYGDDRSLCATTSLALPYNPPSSLVDAEDLLLDIGGTSVVSQICRFNECTNGVDCYTGLSAPPFPLVPAEAYFVQLRPGVPTRTYSIVGTHDPSYLVSFDGAGTGCSRSGFSFYAPPYHAASTDASLLIDELGGTSEITQVQRLEVSFCGGTSYTGLSGTPFPLVPGDGYFVQLRPGVPSIAFVPAHF